MTKICFELSVEILLLIYGVHERVQTNTILAILIQNIHGKSVLSDVQKFRWDLDQMIVKNARGIPCDRFFIHKVIRDLKAPEVQAKRF